MSSVNNVDLSQSPEASPMIESQPKRRFPTRAIALFLALVLFGFLGYQAELVLPARPPNLNSTYTPATQAPPSSIGSYDVLGKVVSQSEADRLLQTEAGKAQLSSEQGAVEINQDLIDFGRDVFYRETFGNERFLTDVAGALDGPINLATITTAIVKLGGKPTSNLQVPVDRDITLGGREFKAGTLLNTGLDVPTRSLLPLGMRTELSHGKVRVGITCAFCHATVDRKTGKILEGAPNNDLNSGLILASASNSAAMFRNTGVNPTQFPAGDHE